MMDGWMVGWMDGWMTALQQWPHYSDLVLNSLMFRDKSKDGSVSKAAFKQQTRVAQC